MPHLVRKGKHEGHSLIDALEKVHALLIRLAAVVVALIKLDEFAKSGYAGKLDRANAVMPEMRQEQGENAKSREMVGRD